MSACMHQPQAQQGHQPRTHLLPPLQRQGEMSGLRGSWLSAVSDSRQMRQVPSCCSAAASLLGCTVTAVAARCCTGGCSRGAVSCWCWCWCCRLLLCPSCCPGWCGGIKCGGAGYAGVVAESCCAVMLVLLCDAGDGNLATEGVQSNAGGHAMRTHTIRPSLTHVT